MGWRHGLGFVTMADKNLVGHWIENFPSGYGMIVIDSSGAKIIGEFRKDGPWNAFSYSPSGKRVGKFKEGEYEPH